MWGLINIPIFVIGAILVYYGLWYFEFCVGKLFLRGILMLIAGLSFSGLGFLGLYVWIMLTLLKLYD